MTAYIVWKPFYSVGDPSLDAQHKQIIAIINDLYAATEKGENPSRLTGLLDRLCEYTIVHFRHEERVMEEHGYPHLTEHTALHETLRRRTAGLRSHVSLVTNRDLLRFLKEWWLDHIQGEDKKYAPYLAAPVEL